MGVSAYDGVHPLLDVGCAYGRNVAAAAQVISQSEKEVRVVACDCADEHLAAVDELAIEGVQTVFGKLPGDFEKTAAVACDTGGFSGILVSEVFHFLSGDSIETSLSSLKDLLAPGGKLCITMFSPQANFCGLGCPVGDHMRKVFAEREAAGAKWPGEGHDIRTLLEQSNSFIDGNEETMKQVPSFFHLATAAQLKAAAERSGFQVLVATEGRHPGHSSTFHNQGGESTQIVAVKPTVAAGGA